MIRTSNLLARDGLFYLMINLKALAAFLIISLCIGHRASACGSWTLQDLASNKNFYMLVSSTKYSDPLREDPVIFKKIRKNTAVSKSVIPKELECWNKENSPHQRIIVFHTWNSLGIDPHIEPLKNWWQ